MLWFEKEHLLVTEMVNSVVDTLYSKGLLKG